MPAKKASAKKATKPAPAAANPAAAAEPKPPVASAPTEVKLTAAKGRPMLQWVGKKPLSRVTAFPAQLVESFDPAGELQNPAAATQSGQLFHGDNKEVLAHLLANGYRGKVDLIYIDPPFDSGADYVRKVTLRGKSALAKLDGETYSLGEQVQYTDIWANDNYLQFMFERLILLKELLADDGTFWLHCDSERGHYLKCILDEVFGPDNFVNQVVWKRSDAHNDAGQGATHLGTIHDMILVFRRGPDQKWNTVYLPLPQSTIDNWYRNVEEETGRRYNRADITGPGGPVKGNPVYEWKGITKAWRFSKERMTELDKQNRIYYAESGMPYLKRYLDESKGIPIQDWWDDIQMVRGIQRRADSLYPTEKPEPLLERILQICTNPNDLVLDCFIGSGTTAAVAQKLGRRWIGCDINKGAIQTTSKRLQGIIREQLAARDKAAEQAKGDLFGGEGATTVAGPPPAALSFRVHRVNHYDLAVQHNEAVALACEHIGVTRSKTDSYFDGTQGKRLVKIIPFNHPLSPADLEQLKDELRARENEERDILLVCLGKELACETWLTDWGRLRKRGDVPNKIEVIELRTDPKYGKFLTHVPASAKVSVKRKGGELHVTIDDFTSPTIIERLDSRDSRLFKAHVTDWRFLVDCVMIDPAYDGQTFQIALTDLPEKKTDLVTGTYTLPAPEAKTIVAVKIIDMLGEEVIVISQI